MSYRVEKNGEDNDIVIDGWERGIAPSPHKGIANIQNANISTELGEVNCSFVRTNQTIQATISGGTLTASSGDGITLLAAPSTLYGGQWINITSATITRTTAPVSYLVLAGGGGGGGTSGTGNAGGGGGAGGLLTGSATTSITSYTITVGAGGAGGVSDGVGANGSNSLFGSFATATGGGGGATDSTSASTGGSGGGGSAAGSHQTGASGTSGQGNAGGNGGGAGVNVGGGGGGGAGAVGTNEGGTAAGNGGNGTASSISGSSVTYGGGGGGGGSGTITAGTGGTGGGGAGGTGTGVAGTANTGGGGGGAGASGGTAHTGGAGGSGEVVISYPTGSITATGGAITTSGGNTIHTFTSSGTFAISAMGTLPTGNYYVSYKDTSNKVKLSNYYDPSAANAITHGTSGTATFNLTIVIGSPISKATEKCSNATTTQYRYYILDANGYVWVYDTAVYTASLASSGIGITWALPDPTDYSASHFNNICILDGWLMILNNTQIDGKPTVNLGTGFTILTNAYLNDPLPTHTNFAYAGHQGRMYWCDGSYLGSMFPDTSLLTGSSNVQSFSKYTASTVFGTVTQVISGSIPYTADATGAVIRIPAVFFTDQFGTVPSSLSAQTVYYIQYNISGGLFGVYDALTGGSAKDIETGAIGNQYFNTFYPQGTHSGIYGDATTVTFSPQRLNLPSFEISQYIAEIGNTIIVGCAGNVVYPWNQTDVTPSGIITLPESNVVKMLTVNQMAYIFAGNQGNVYITDGSVASLVLNVPDYVAGVPGLPGTYIESTYTWGDVMYLRGRVYFSLLDQLSDVIESDIVTNGSFTGSASGWTLGTGWSYSSNSVSHTPGSDSELSQVLTDVIANTTYTCTYTITVSAGTVDFETDFGGNNQHTDYTSSGTYTVYRYSGSTISGPGDQTILFNASADFNGTIDSVSVTITKIGNCGGIWSFYPTQNLYIGQDTGLALRLESQNSYNTYNGVDTILIPNQQQVEQQPLYWSGWYSSVTNPTYGIDYSTGGTDENFPAVVETDAVPIGTMLNKKTTNQIEYKLGAPLDTDATITAKYRVNITDVWTDCDEFVVDTSRLGGYARANFQQLQWLQLQFTLIPITSSASTNTFIRFREVRIR